MNNPEKIISEALALPPETRAFLADRLLFSLIPSNRAELDRLWAEEAEYRVQQIKNGDVEVIPGKDVFKKIRESITL